MHYVHVIQLLDSYIIFSKIQHCISTLHTRDIVYSLLLYGMLCCLDERYLEAGEFFELATATDPNSVIAWTIRGKHNNYNNYYIIELSN